MYCNNCGTKLRKNSNFCHICGNKIKDVEIYVRENDEPIPSQISMKDLFNSSETKEFKKIEQNKSGKFSELLNSFRSKTTVPDAPLEGDNEISIKLDKKIDKDRSFDKEDIEIKAPLFNLDKDKDKEDLDIKKPSKSSNESVLKRFFDYMREEEIIDESLSKKKSGVEEITEEGFEKDVAVEVIGTEDVLNEEDQTPVNLPNPDDLIDDKVDVMMDDEDFEEEIKEEKIKSPSMITKVKDFLSEEDEDNLLELSPEEYKEIMYGQGTEEDLGLEKKPGLMDKFLGIFKKDDKDLSDELEDMPLEFEEKPEEKTIDDSIKVEPEVDSDPVDKKPGIFASVVSFFKGDDKKDLGESEEEDDYDYDYDHDEEVANTDFQDFKTIESSNKGNTIRYSKKVINSYLDEEETPEVKEEEKPEVVIEEDPVISEILKEEEIREEIEEPKETKKTEYEFLTGRVRTEPKEKVESEVFIAPELIKEKPIKEEVLEEEAEPKEKGPGIFTPVIDFFKSIGKFFVPSNTGTQDEYEKDNIDIILNSSTSSMDTMPLVLSEEEKKILNDEITKRQGLSKQEMVLKKSNAKVTPIIRSLIDLGAKIRIPLMIVSLGISLWTISWSLKNGIFIGILGVIKFFITYLTIFIATNSAFNSIGLRLKRSVVSLFIFLQMIVYQIFDAIYIRLTMINGPSTEAIIHVFSPKIFSILFFIVLAFMLLLFNYKKVSERNKTMMFLGWYIVTSATITLMVILLELLLVTIMSTLFIDVMF